LTKLLGKAATRPIDQAAQFRGRSGGGRGIVQKSNGAAVVTEQGMPFIVVRL